MSLQLEIERLQALVMDLKRSRQESRERETCLMKLLDQERREKMAEQSKVLVKDHEIDVSLIPMKSIFL